MKSAVVCDHVEGDVMRAVVRRRDGANRHAMSDLQQLWVLCCFRPYVRRPTLRNAAWAFVHSERQVNVLATDRV
jgi:hypothetical protein